MSRCDVLMSKLSATMDRDNACALLDEVIRERAHDAKCESELTSHGYTPCRCEERSAVPSRQQLLDLVKEVAGLSLLIADNDREFKLIQRARTLVGQPEF